MLEEKKRNPLSPFSPVAIFPVINDRILLLMFTRMLTMGLFILTILLIIAFSWML